MALTRLNELFAELYDEVGGPITLDEKGECVLERDGGGECVVKAPLGGTSFVLSAVVGFLYRQDGEALLAGLLQLNGDLELTLGGGISLDESGEVIIYRYLMDIEGLDSAGLKELVDNFFAVTENLREEIAALREAVDGTAHRQSEARETFVRA